MFQASGVLAATVGWLAARALYKDGQSEVPARLKARFEAAWTVVYNKYYVDELYDARRREALGRPRPARSAGSTARVIDGLVNFAGAVGRFLGRFDAAHRQVPRRRPGERAWRTRPSGLGRALRHVQTGRIQTYLYGALGGALVVVLLNFLIS